MRTGSCHGRTITIVPSCTRFVRYHADNDDSHMDKLYGLIDRICTSPQAADEVVRTATVVGRLYAMQLEEIDRGR